MKIKVVYHRQMGKRKGKLFLVYFIYRNDVVFTGSGPPPLSLSLSVPLLRGGERLLRLPLDLPLFKLKSVVFCP